MEPTSAQSPAPVAPAEAVAAPADSADAPKAEIAVEHAAAQPDCLVTVEDGTSPVALALAGLAVLGLFMKLARGKKRA
jgi:hypothetical protein